MRRDKLFGMSSPGARPQFEDSDECFQRGVVLARKGLWKEALAAYQESLRVNPDKAQTYLNLGFVYYEMGNDQEAQQAFDRACKLQARPCIK